MNWKLDLVVKREYEEHDQTLCFPSTSLVKVLVLSFCTIGIYPWILIYNYWKTLKTNFGYTNISPFWRTLFCHFMNFSLFPILGNYANAFKKNIHFPILLAIIFFITWYHQTIRKLSYQYSSTPQASFMEIIADILFVLGVLIVAYIQFVINRVNKENFPDAPQNKWSVANTIWLIVGLVIYAFALYAISQNNNKTNNNY